MLEKKLERPPYVHNWVRNVGPDLQSTIKRLVRLAHSFPTKTYSAATPIIIDRVISSLDRATAVRAALTTGHINSRQIVADYVNAFYDHDENRRYSGRPTFDGMIEPFRITKGLFVPVKPLVNIIENGKLVPIFTVGWATYPLSKFQESLLATIIEDAVFSLRDFRNSPGEFLCFPLDGKGENAIRKPYVWHRGDISLLSQGELRDSLAMYVEALEAAKQILRDMPAQENTKDRRQPYTDPNQLRFPGLE
jgi:hypothetical protein